VSSVYTGRNNFEAPWAIELRLVGEFFPAYSRSDFRIGSGGLGDPRVLAMQRNAMNIARLSSFAIAAYKVRAKGGTSRLKADMIHMLQKRGAKITITFLQEQGTWNEARLSARTCFDLALRKANPSPKFRAVTKSAPVYARQDEPRALSPRAHGTLKNIASEPGLVPSGLRRREGREIGSYHPALWRQSERAVNDNIASGRFGCTANISRTRD